MSELKRIVRFAAGLCLWWASVAAHAYALSFLPAVQSVGLGGKATVEVHVSDVLPGGLGDYDFDVTFDPNIVAFHHAIDGLGLGSAVGLGTTAGAGRVTVSDFSLDPPADLVAKQNNDFVLFSLVFDTLAVGTSPLGFDLVTLGDAAGQPVQPTALNPGRIEVQAVAIPEPTSVALVLAALLAATRPCRHRFR